MKTICKKCGGEAVRVVALTKQETDDEATATFFLGREFHHDEGGTPRVCVEERGGSPFLISLGQASIEKVSKPGELERPRRTRKAKPPEEGQD